MNTNSNSNSNRLPSASDTDMEVDSNYPASDFKLKGSGFNERGAGDERVLTNAELTKMHRLVPLRSPASSEGGKSGSGSRSESALMAAGNTQNFFCVSF